MSPGSQQLKLEIPGLISIDRLSAEEIASPLRVAASSEFRLFGEKVRTG